MPPPATYDPIGTYDALSYKPTGQAPELKYFLVQFVTKHYGRMRATVKAQYAESLYFMEAGLAEATMAHDQRERTIEWFLTGTSDEIEIQVRNVTLEQLREPPYKAVVEFDRVFYAAGNRQERTRETCVANVTFVVRDQVRGFSRRLLSPARRFVASRCVGISPGGEE